MPGFEVLVRAAAESGEYDLEQAILGCDDAVEVANEIADHVSTRLGPVADALFYRRSTGIVAGLRLLDGREVVIKLHRWKVSLPRLLAIAQVQQRLADADLPVPSPLAQPAVFGEGFATIETLRRGHYADARHPEVRRRIAELPSALVELGRPFAGLTDLGEAVLFEGGARGWPEPHDLRFDFDASAGGAEWIDDLAADARGRLALGKTGLVVGHLDWRVGNLAFDGESVSAVYDWDSLALATEPTVVGAAAAGFSADWVHSAALPTPTEMRAFVTDYEVARGRAFDVDERELINAANLLQCAYGARCQHSDAVLAATREATRDGGWIEILRQRAEGGPV